MLDGTLQMANEDEVADEFKKPTEDVEVTVVLRADRDGNFPPELEMRDSKFGPWVSIPMEISDGEFEGTWTNLALTIKGTSRGFRSAVTVVTGKDVSEGGDVDLGEFSDKLASGVFMALVGPDKKKPEYTRVHKLIERVGEREDAPGGDSDSEAPADAGTPADEDLPF